MNFCKVIPLFPIHFLAILIICQQVIIVYPRLLGPEDYSHELSDQKDEDQEIKNRVKHRNFGGMPQLFPPAMNEQNLPYCDEIEVEEKDQIYTITVWLVLGVILAATAIAIYIYLKKVHHFHEDKRKLGYNYDW